MVGSTTLVDQALSFRVPGSLVPIYDSIQQSGLGVFRLALQRLASKHLRHERIDSPGIVVVCYETHPRLLLPLTAEWGNITVLVGATAATTSLALDPLPEGHNAMHRELFDFTAPWDQHEALLTRTVTNVLKQHEQVYMFFDTLTPLLKASTGAALQALQRLVEPWRTQEQRPTSNHNIRIMAMVHEDLDPAPMGQPTALHAGVPVNHALEYLSPLSLRVYNPRAYAQRLDPLQWADDDPMPSSHLDTHANCLDEVVCEAELYKHSRRTERQTCWVRWQAGTAAVVPYTGPHSVDLPTETTAQPSPQSEPAEPAKAPVPGVSFNLALTEEQRAAKNSLVLPHEAVQHTQGSSGAIYYQPDDGDDFDEEDPDDDLDI
ncbi:hypothetical protein H4R35_006176 [Dimargaris xerosporica]|nr:hypothetical protein H4R35_006176 [Dimargaris xerosporica]